MAFEKRDMQGALFFNDKDGNEKRPDVRGYVLINGVEYELAGWTSDSSKVAYSLKAKVKEERRDGRPMQQQSISQRAMPKGPAYGDVKGRRDPISTGRPRPDDAMDDEIPFAPEFRG